MGQTGSLGRYVWGQRLSDWQKTNVFLFTNSLMPPAPQRLWGFKRLWPSLSEKTSTHTHTTCRHTSDLPPWHPSWLRILNSIMNLRKHLLTHFWKVADVISLFFLQADIWFNVFLFCKRLESSCLWVSVQTDITTTEWVKSPGHKKT